MSGDSWRGEKKDPATARAKAFENLQEAAAAVEKAQARFDEAKLEMRIAETGLETAEDAYREAKTKLDHRLPLVREMPA